MPNDLIQGSERAIIKPIQTVDTGGKSVLETYKNIDMENMLRVMEPYLDTATGKFGYAIARNIRKIKDSCAEYLQTRQSLIEQLGEEEKDEHGNPTGIIGVKYGTDSFREFQEKLGQISNIEHSVELYKVSYDVLPDTFTAKEMLNLEWMLFDKNEK